MNQQSNNTTDRKKSPKSNNEKAYTRFQSHRIAWRDRFIYLHRPRGHYCLRSPGNKFLQVKKLSHIKLRFQLAACETIEHQFITLREKTQLSPHEFDKRYQFTQLLLDCLRKHHNVIYEGLLYGSTVNGLGFKDSDVDLRLRPLKEIGTNLYEPVILDEGTVERTLRNIAYQTNLCCPASGSFVPSSRCPVAKLSFHRVPENGETGTLVGDEALSYDVSLSSLNSLGIFNSMFLRFLCYLEPKFHLLASALRYWSNRHSLIQPGLLSSYALINMLIYFCQVVQPPLLPSVDYMRELYFAFGSRLDIDAETLANQSRGLTQLEYACLICMRKELYTPSTNTEPLAVLLLKFFELYLNFPYSTHIITIRPGYALSHVDFKISNQYHPRFPIQPILNIQDPFDLKHNLTYGMQASHFRKFLTVIRHSYETLFKELMNNFTNPESRGAKRTENGKIKRNHHAKDWGLGVLFLGLPAEEFK